MKIVPFSQLPLSTFTNCFNEAFADYFVPFHTTDEFWKGRFKKANTDQELSIIVMDGDQAVAFIHTGVDDINGIKTAYNGGTGVIPSHRGQRLTTYMYAYLFEAFKKAGIQQSILEVIQKNTKAMKIYEHLGFKKTRGFNCFSGQFKKTNISLLAGYTYAKMETIDRSLFTSFWAFTPSWGYTLNAIERTQDVHEIGSVLYQNKCIGYIAYEPATGSVSQIAVAKAHRNKGIGKYLLAQAQLVCKNDLNLVNVDAQQWATLAFLQKAGFKNPINQYEMKWVAEEVL